MKRSAASWIFADALRLNAATSTRRPDPHFRCSTSGMKSPSPVTRMITSKKESITKPLNEALRNARAFFAPIEEQWAGAERIVKDKMVAYQNEQIARAAKEAIKVEKKVEKKPEKK